MLPRLVSTSPAPTKIAQLDAEIFSQALDCLAADDAGLRTLIARHGPPPLWARPPGFETLVLIILEQQVTLASGKAAFERLAAAVSPLTPDHLASIDPAALRSIGLTRQKAQYCVGLARAVRDRQLDLQALAIRPDDEVRSALTVIKGIGRWTADVYLMLALRRADVWPVGDLALATAAARLTGRDSPLPPLDMEALAEPWRPWRSVAARVLWHGYLASRGPTFSG